MTDRPTLVVMLGGMSGGPLERLMRRALEASALDTLEVALGTGRFDRALLLADEAPASPVPEGVTVEVDGAATGSATGDSALAFQYGERLAEAVATHGIGRLVYLGGGSAPLLDAASFEALADGIEGGAGSGTGAATGDVPVCVTNN